MQFLHKSEVFKIEIGVSFVRNLFAETFQKSHNLVTLCADCLHYLLRKKFYNIGSLEVEEIFPAKNARVQIAARFSRDQANEVGHGGL